VELRVEVVLARPGAADAVSLSLAPGATLRDALVASGLPLDLEKLAFGIFGRRAQLDHRLADGDRVEVYRPLKVDPKEARRKRAREQR
jgi:hypothetical protein